MAKQSSAITFTGKLGNLVGSKGMKGNQILRQAPTSVRDPQTPAQVRQRARFRGATEAANNVPVEALAGLRPYAAGKRVNVRNAYTSILLKERIIPMEGSQQGESIVYTADWDRIIFSKGNRLNMDFEVPEFDDPLKVHITGTRSPETNDNDIIHVIVYVQDAEKWIHRTATVAEITAGIDVIMPQSYTGMKCHVYTYTQTLDPLDANFDYNALPYSGVSIERELVESRSAYSPTSYIGTGNIG